jgi:hypothetical protein
MCFECGAELPPGAVFCPFCGQEVSRRIPGEQKSLPGFGVPEQRSLPGLEVAVNSKRRSVWILLPKKPGDG